MAGSNPPHPHGERALERGHYTRIWASGIGRALQCGTAGPVSESTARELTCENPLLQVVNAPAECSIVQEQCTVPETPAQNSSKLRRSPPTRSTTSILSYLGRAHVWPRNLGSLSSSGYIGLSYTF